MAVDVGERGEAPSLAGGAEVAVGDESLFVQSRGSPVEDVYGTDHGGPVDMFADNDRRGGGDVAPTTAGVALVLGGAEAVGVFHVVGEGLGPERFFGFAFFADDLRGHLQVLNLTGGKLNATNEKATERAEIVVVTHDEVGEIGEGFLRFGSSGEGLVFERDVFAVLPKGDGDAFDEGLRAARLAGSEVEGAVSAVGEVVGGVLLEGGVLVAGKFVDARVPD